MKRNKKKGEANMNKPSFYKHLSEQENNSLTSIGEYRSGLVARFNELKEEQAKESVNDVQKKHHQL